MKHNEGLKSNGEYEDSMAVNTKSKDVYFTRKKSLLATEGRSLCRLERDYLRHWVSVNCKISS